MCEQLIEFREEMECSLYWRLDEYRHLKNVIKDDNKIAVVKVLIVMLYAHFEGFFRDCMECYIKFVNSTNRKVKEFNNSLITATLTKQFSSFEDMNRKCKELISVPPTEDYLHKFHRRKDLTKLFNSDYLDRQIRIKDSIINTKSNLMYCVWQENFYLLGLDEKYFHEYQPIIDKLVNLRNSVAHGSQREPIDFQEYQVLEGRLFELMDELIKYLFKYCFDEIFLSN